MINSTNVVLLSGVLRQDPVIVNFRDANRLARFTLQVNKFIQNEPDDPQCTSSDFNIVLFNENLDKVQYQLKKGIKISLEGYLITCPYTNKHGEQVETIEIVANRIEVQ